VRAFEVELDYVLRTLRRHGVSPAEAPDLAQDVFLVMWRRWADFDSSRPLRAWLAGIAYRIARDHLKRGGRFVPRAWLDAPDQRPLADDQIASARARDLVLRALHAVPPKLRPVLVMHDLDGLPMHRIAALLAVPVFTGYSRLRLARKAFAKAVERAESQPGWREAGPSSAPALLALEREPPPASAAIQGQVLARVRALSLLPPSEIPWPRPALEGAAARVWLATAGAAALVVLAVLASLGPGRGKPASGPAAQPSARASLRVPTAPLLRPAAVAGGPAENARPPALTPVTPPAPEAALGRGLIGYWRFDEGKGSAAARDLSGNGNDCSLRPTGGREGWTEGVLGGALILDGHRWLECARLEPMARLERELTIAVWVKPERLVAGRQVFVARQLGDGEQDYFSLGLWHTKVEVRGNLWQSGTRREWPAPLGEWIHVAAVQREDGRRLLYVDGVEIGLSNRSRPVSLGGGTSLLTIGGAFNGADRTRADELFQGAIDELLVYDRALDRREIVALAGRAQPRL
jgi:RNA polymerase sigma-70 factor (ECF subfamily)